MRRGARVVESGGLENRCTRKRTVGSNPTLSASISHVFIAVLTSVVETTADRRDAYLGIFSDADLPKYLASVSSILALNSLRPAWAVQVS